MKQSYHIWLDCFVDIGHYIMSSMKICGIYV